MLSFRPKNSPIRPFCVCVFTCLESSKQASSRLSKLGMSIYINGSGSEKIFLSKIWIILIRNFFLHFFCQYVNGVKSTGGATAIGGVEPLLNLLCEGVAAAVGRVLLVPNLRVELLRGY